MFTSSPSSHPNNGMFGQGNQNNGGPSTWSFGQTSSPLSTPTTTSAYGFGISTSGGANVTRSIFDNKQSDFGGKERGSRIENYKRTPEAENSGEKIVSISGMPVYNNKSHEELRWEDYKFTKEGGFGFGIGSAVKKSTSSGLSPFSSSPVSTNSWGTTSPMKPNPFGKSFHSRPTSQPLAFDSPSLSLAPFTNQISSSGFSSPTPPSSFNATPFTSTSNSMRFVSWNFPGPTSTSQPLNSASPSFSLPPLNHNPFKIPSSSFSNSMSSVSCSTFNQPTTLFTSSSASTPFPLISHLSFEPTSSPNTCVTTVSSAPFTPFINPFTNTSSSTLLSPTFAPFTSTDNFNKEVTGSGIGQITTVSVASPFGTLPPKSHLSFKPSIQYGISSMPVKEKPSLVRYPILTTRHLSRRNKLPLRKYHPQPNNSKMPFFSDTKDIPVPVLVPRENPRALVVYPEKMLPRVVDLLPKLQLPDYYTKPQISELESKERTEPGYCSRVNDFVIGRHGYGSIKFLGETDVRNLEIESFVQFNNREVIVYMDESKKPPVGEGLNKPAEITLLNIKCIDKRSGVEYKDGLKVDKYREMLKKKVVGQGGEFVSYDPVEGEWKFRVQHF